MKKLVVSTLLLVSLIAVLAGCGNWGHQEQGPEVNPKAYSAVTLDNNLVYFGKLDKAGTAFPVLTDIYFIQSQVNQETKAVTNVLTRRANDVHGPDRMFLNSRHILFIEPVGPNSKVAQLIEADKNKH